MILDDIILDRPSPPSATAFEGEFARGVASESEKAYVIITSASREHSYGPCPWPPRGVDLPARGDRCLVTFAENGSPWVIGWWPA